MFTGPIPFGVSLEELGCGAVYLNEKNIYVYEKDFVSIFLWL